MKAFRITSPGGLDMGVFEGESEQDAYEAMMVDAGYTGDPRAWRGGDDEDWSTPGEGFIFVRVN